MKAAHPSEALEFRVRYAMAAVGYELWYESWGCGEANGWEKKNASREGAPFISFPREVFILVADHHRRHAQRPASPACSVMSKDGQVTSG